MSHVVVIGGSIAGLTAARALSESVDRVTMLERDPLPSGVADRASVPHAKQPLARSTLSQQRERFPYDYLASMR